MPIVGRVYKYTPKNVLRRCIKLGEQFGEVRYCMVPLGHTPLKHTIGMWVTKENFILNFEEV